MFTGIVTYRGRLQKVIGANYTFSAPEDFCRKLTEGISVAINGACLTVAKKGKNSFSVEVMPETVKRTTLGKLQEGDMINLELPATPKTFLSGHIVQGHIDVVAKISNVKRQGNSYGITINVPVNLTRYIVPKGSITVNGISLTVITASKTSFTVSIIPYTWNHTTFSTLRVNDTVNIEVDVLAKYVERLLTKGE